MFSSDRNEFRKVFFESWKKYCEQLPIEPLEQQVIQVILQHPEYHELLNQQNTYQEKEFEEENPFLHLGLHIAVQEQINTNRPSGIQEIFHQLHQKLGNPHLAEHKIINCLAQLLWEAQQNNTAPDEKHYLTQLRLLISETA